MNLGQLNNIIINEVEPFKIIKGSTSWQIKENKQLFKLLNKKYNSFFKFISELIYLTQNKNKLENLNIFCNCGNKNNFISSKKGYLKYCSSKCCNNNKIKKQKSKQTALNNIDKNGLNSYLRGANKGKNTRLNDIDENGLNSYQRGGKKADITKIKTIDDKGNNGYFRQINESKKTNLKKYGKNFYTQTDKFKNLWKDKEFVRQRQQKQYLTKKKNNSLSTSKPEDECFKLLKNKFLDTIHHYRSNLYPFNCDFFIPSIDFYIECHFSHFHNFKPFDKNNKEHLNELEILINKCSKTNKKNQYNNIIYTWTNLDVRKLECFKENNLNYKVFYNENEFNNWLINL